MTTAPERALDRPEPALRLPGTVQIGVSRGIFEVREFFKEWESVVFSFSLPALILMLFTAIFGEMDDAGMEPITFYLPGLIAMGLMSVSLQTLGISIAVERDQGLLRRLRGTPMPPAAYFAGKTVLVGILAAGQVAVLLGVAMAFGLQLPAEPGRWGVFAMVLVLGTAACALLGIAMSSLARSARTASGIVVVPFLAMQFISGIFVPIMILPDWMVDIASLLPLKWMAQGMRYVFYPEEAAALEPSGSFDLPLVAGMLGLWCVVGLVLCLLTFRWKTAKDG